MKSTHYSDKVLDHFRHPRNTGTLKGEDVARGRVGNPVCGDLMEIYIKVRDERIEDIKFKTFGCGSAVATASMVTELAKGKSLVEASRITLLSLKANKSSTLWNTPLFMNSFSPMISLIWHLTFLTN